MVFEAENGQLEAGQRGRPVKTRRAELPELSEYVDEAYAEYVREAKFHRGVLLVHEFVRSIIEDRRPRIDSVAAASWTAAGICAHQSALQDGEPLDIPDFG